MSPITYNINNAEFREKMAAFDYDWTLVNPKDGKTFPSNIDDWQWLYPNIAGYLRKYYDDGFMIVIFTNQSKAWKCDQIKLVSETLNIPLFVVISMDKEEHKPNPLMFHNLLKGKEGNEGNTINKDKSFFVGDALGRKIDFSDSDKIFAENIGLKCFSPEKFFHADNETFEIPSIPLKDDKEIIIMTGFPGSGKSTIAKEICKNDNYIHIESDIYKTFGKMKKKALEHIPENKSFVFDATNSSIKKRKEYILLGDKYNYKIRCIHVIASKDVSYKRNILRGEEKHVPKIAYSVYSKHYEEPNEIEGFELIII